MKLKYALFTVAIAIGSPAMAETLTNDTVVSMIDLGLGDEAIIAKIAASEPEYDLSVENMTELKNRGVSSAVIAAMITAKDAKANMPLEMSLDSADPLVPHASGVYLVDNWSGAPKMVRIDSTVSNQAKTGGILGYALTSGLASMSIKAAIPNATARTDAQTTSPVFYMFFDESNPQLTAQASNWQSGDSTTVTSPNEFTLIKLLEKKGRREARVGSVNIGGAKTGVMDKDQIAFDYDLVRPGVYKVTPNRNLEKGEYGFLYGLAGGNVRGAMTARIFDFTVK